LLSAPTVSGRSADDGLDRFVAGSTETSGRDFCFGARLRTNALPFNHALWALRQWRLI